MGHSTSLRTTQPADASGHAFTATPAPHAPEARIGGALAIGNGPMTIGRALVTGDGPMTVGGAQATGDGSIMAATRARGLTASQSPGVQAAAAGSTAEGAMPHPLAAVAWAQGPPQGCHSGAERSLRRPSRARVSYLAPVVKGAQVYRQWILDDANASREASMHPEY